MAPSSPLNIKDIIDPLLPLLEAKRAAIDAIVRKTYTYGPTDAHQLDVYYPPSPTQPDSKPPIVVFFHGGSLFRGSRSSAPQNLVHNNLGAYFASRGILAIVADYRLVPNAIFPQGSEDVRDTLLWVIEHASEGDSSQIYVIGHSAGGIHVASMLLLPRLFPPLLRQAVRGIILISVPYEVPGEKKLEFREAVTKYYGRTQKIASNHPLGLLRHAETEWIATLPFVRNLMAESDPRYIKAATRAFSKLFKRKGGSLDDFLLEGHDHMSPILALSTGSGEEWGQEIVNWILKA